MCVCVYAYVFGLNAQQQRQEDKLRRCLDGDGGVDTHGSFARCRERRRLKSPPVCAIEGICTVSNATPGKRRVMLVLVLRKMEIAHTELRKGGHVP